MYITRTQSTLNYNIVYEQKIDNLIDKISNIIKGT